MLHLESGYRMKELKKEFSTCRFRVYCVSAGQKNSNQWALHFQHHHHIWSIIINKIGPNGQCSKIINFNRIEAGITSKFRQQFNGAIRSSLSAPYNDVRHRTSLKTLIFFFFLTLPLAHVELYKWQIWGSYCFYLHFYFNLLFL